MASKAHGFGVGSCALSPFFYFYFYLYFGRAHKLVTFAQSRLSGDSHKQSLKKRRLLPCVCREYGRMDNEFYAVVVRIFYGTHKMTVKIKIGYSKNGGNNSAVRTDSLLAQHCNEIAQHSFYFTTPLSLSCCRPTPLPPPTAATIKCR